MVWEMLLYIYILYSPDWHYKSTMPTFLFIYAAIFAVVHSLFHLGITFKVHYMILCLLCIPRTYKYYIHTEDKSAKWLARYSAITLLLGGLCWICDRLFCKEFSRSYFNPQGHALWHILMGFCYYYANMFFMFCRAQQRGWNPKVMHFMGFFPYVKIEKPKAQWKKLLWEKVVVSYSIEVGATFLLLVKLKVVAFWIFSFWLFSCPQLWPVYCLWFKCLFFCFSFWFDGQGCLGQVMHTSTNPLPSPVKSSPPTPRQGFRKKLLSCGLIPRIEPGQFCGKQTQYPPTKRT